MAARVGSFNLAERCRKKHLARLAQEDRLREGKAGRGALRRENGFFAALDVAGAAIVPRRTRKDR